MAPFVQSYLQTAESALLVRDVFHTDDGSPSPPKSYGRIKWPRSRRIETRKRLSSVRKVSLPSRPHLFFPKISEVSAPEDLIKVRCSRGERILQEGVLYKISVHDPGDQSRESI
jgi:hypothetical protein